MATVLLHSFVKVACNAGVQYIMMRIGEDIHPALLDHRLIGLAGKKIVQTSWACNAVALIKVDLDIMLVSDEIIA